MKTNNKEGYFFLGPYFAFFSVFVIIPIALGVVISFLNWGLLDKSAEFVGLANYQTLLFDKESWAHQEFFNALENTVLFTLIFVPLVVTTSLALAVFVTKIPGRAKHLFRTVYFLPYAVSVAAVGVMWKWVFNTQSGILNAFLANFGIEPIGWLNTEPFAAFTIIVATLWWTVGFCMIIFVNALNDIPDEVYEAADIDGASAWKQFTKISMPHIEPALMFVIITQVIASLNLYGQADMMTNGGPDKSTQTVVMVIFDQAFGMKELGMASAMAIVFALIIMAISGVLVYISRKVSRSS